MMPTLPSWAAVSVGTLPASAMTPAPAAAVLMRPRRDRLDAASWVARPVAGVRFILTSPLLLVRRCTEYGSAEFVRKGRAAMRWGGDIAGRCGLLPGVTRFSINSLMFQRSMVP